jgi:hypothetical protein
VRPRTRQGGQRVDDHRFAEQHWPLLHYDGQQPPECLNKRRAVGLGYDVHVHGDAAGQAALGLARASQAKLDLLEW